MLNVALTLFMEYHPVLFWTLMYLIFSFAIAILVGRAIKSHCGDYND